METINIDNAPTLPSGIEIIDNAQLDSVSLSSVEIVGGSKSGDNPYSKGIFIHGGEINGDPSITNIDFSSLTWVWGNIAITTTLIVDMTGFSALEQVHYIQGCNDNSITLYNNNMMTSLDGLESLEYLGLTAHAGYNESLPYCETCQFFYGTDGNLYDECRPTEEDAIDCSQAP